MQTIPKPIILKQLFPFLALSFFLMNSSLRSESIRLTSGQVLEGKIMEESEKVLIFKTGKGTFTIQKTDILEMERPDSKNGIVKPPEEKKLSILKMSLMSFIPGYSPLYHSKEHPEFGIPLAMANLNFFYRFMQFQTNSRRVGYLNSIEMKNPLGIVTLFGVGPDLVSREFYANNPSPQPNNGPGLEYSRAFYIYFALRSSIYNNHPDRVVSGVTYSEDEYFKIRNKYLTNYVMVSIVQAAFSYYILHGEGNLGSFYKTEFNGIRTAFYAFPTQDGGIFAAVSKF